jgi:hypothetical protein
MQRSLTDCSCNMSSVTYWRIWASFPLCPLFSSLCPSLSPPSLCCRATVEHWRWGTVTVFLDGLTYVLYMDPFVLGISHTCTGDLAPGNEGFEKSRGHLNSSSDIQPWLLLVQHGRLSTMLRHSWLAHSNMQYCRLLSGHSRWLPTFQLAFTPMLQTAHTHTHTHTVILPHFSDISSFSFSGCPCYHTTLFICS